MRRIPKINRLAIVIVENLDEPNWSPIVVYKMHTGEYCFRYCRPFCVAGLIKPEAHHRMAVDAFDFEGHIRSFHTENERRSRRDSYRLPHGSRHIH
jgi:hypothetical protein